MRVTAWLVRALIALLAANTMVGCSKPAMKPLRGEVERAMDALNAASRGISARESEAARQSEERKKDALKEMYIDPIAAVGFDRDKSVRVIVEKFLAKDFGSEEEEQIFTVFVAHFAQRTPEFERFRLIDAETAGALKRVKL